MRPFCIATIGGILGIIVGLYLRSIALFVVLFILLVLFIVWLLNPFKDKKRLIKVSSIFLLSFFMFWFYTTLQEDTFEQINQKYGKKEIEIQAVVMNDGEEKEYKDVYQIQVIKIKEDGQESKHNFKMILNVKRQSGQSNLLKYGDMIGFKSTYEEPSKARNEGGFDYKQYLKTKKVIGIATIKSGEVKILHKSTISLIAKLVHDIRKNIVERIRKILPEDEANLCTGLLVGDKIQLSDDIQEMFSKSNLSHMLAISGAHVSYILLGATTVIDKIKFHKRWGKVFLIIFFVFFMALTGFTPSVSRSCIMVILQLLASILFRKSDTYQNLAISSFIILLVNPYTLLDIGFQLSFGGTIGIVIFSKKLLNHYDDQKSEIVTKRRKGIITNILRKMKEMCIVTLSANLIIIPIMMYHFNTFSFTFFISNLLASPVLGISLILGMILIVSLSIFSIAKLLSFFLQPILQILIWIAEFSSGLPFSQILVPTPKIWQIILYYLFLLLFFLPKVKLQNKQNFMERYKKLIIISFTTVMIFPYLFQVIPNNKIIISFIDVRQGDSMLIQTPSHKTILIDGGGSETGSFDVGEKTLIPYLLDKGIMSIDYMIFSHFDSDHCQGLLSVMEELKVRNAIISKQGEKSNNYVQFLEVAKRRKVKIVVVQAGDKITIDSQCYLSVLFPTEELISTNVLNNNSIVAKFVYQPKQANEFSLLLTGDIEKIAEEKLCEMYQGTDKLQANILKVAHHRLQNIFCNTVFRISKTKDCTSWSGREKYFWSSKQDNIR